jgi:hypothetical protein
MHGTYIGARDDDERCEYDLATGSRPFQLLGIYRGGCSTLQSVVSNWCMHLGGNIWAASVLLYCHIRRRQCNNNLLNHLNVPETKLVYINTSGSLDTVNIAVYLLKLGLIWCMIKSKFMWFMRERVVIIYWRTRSSKTQHECPYSEQLTLAPVLRKPAINRTKSSNKMVKYYYNIVVNLLWSKLNWWITCSYYLPPAV